MMRPSTPRAQLSTLYDISDVNILRGPQGTGLARNASAGAIKIYTRKPTGEFGGYPRPNSATSMRRITRAPSRLRS
jgi:outer membrane receptor protein involved in Fe transport